MAQPKAGDGRLGRHGVRWAEQAANRPRVRSAVQFRFSSGSGLATPSKRKNGMLRCRCRVCVCVCVCCWWWLSSWLKRSSHPLVRPAMCTIQTRALPAGSRCCRLDSEPCPSLAPSSWRDGHLPPCAYHAVVESEHQQQHQQWWWSSSYHHRHNPTLPRRRNGFLKRTGASSRLCTPNSLAKTTSSSVFGPLATHSGAGSACRRVSAGVETNDISSQPKPNRERTSVRAYERRSRNQDIWQKRIGRL